MYIGNFAADSYYSVKSYATYPANSAAAKTVKCMRECPWYNPFCQNACVAAEAGYQTQKKGVEAVNQGIQNLGEQLGKGFGAAGETLSRTLIMLSIAAIGVVAIAMVIR